jgi:hypothetical protein
VGVAGRQPGGKHRFELCDLLVEGPVPGRFQEFELGVEVVGRALEVVADALRIRDGGAGGFPELIPGFQVLAEVFTGLVDLIDAIGRAGDALEPGLEPGLEPLGQEVAGGPGRQLDGVDGRLARLAFLGVPDELGGVRGLGQGAELLVTGGLAQAGVHRDSLDGGSDLVAGPVLGDHAHKAVEGVDPRVVSRGDLAGRGVTPRDGLDSAHEGLGHPLVHLRRGLAERAQERVGLALGGVLPHLADVRVDAAEPLLNRLIALIESLELVVVHRRPELAGRPQSVEELHERIRQCRTALITHRDRIRSAR